MRLAVIWIMMQAILPAQQIAISEYALPNPQSSPLGIVAGPDGALWFTENVGRIGRITTAGIITEYEVPTAGSGPWGITTGPDGALWFTEVLGNNIGRITTAGAITDYAVPSANSWPIGIAVGPDGALWFTEQNASKIGRITTTGTITEFVLPPGNYPEWITAGPDGAMWFTQFSDDGLSNGKIGRLTTDGSIAEFVESTPYTLPFYITPGSDGALWYAENEETSGAAIGRITTGGAITEFPLTAITGTEGITAGPDGALWFAELNRQNAIGRITTAGAITTYPMPGNCMANGMTAGPNGTLWFTDNVCNKIGEIVFLAGLTVTPSHGYYKSELTFEGSGFSPDETVQIYSGGLGSAVLASAIAGSDGSFTVGAVAPDSAYGPRVFIAAGRESGKQATANFSIAPRLILNPPSGATGSTAAVNGFGFGVQETVKVWWNSPRTLLGVISADVHGTFGGGAALKFTVPPAAQGKNGIFGVGETSGALGSGSFTVE